MNRKHKQYLQRLEAKAWIDLAKAHFEFTQIHGTFDTLEEYDNALGEDKAYMDCLAKWSEIDAILRQNNIPIDYQLHREGAKLALKEPKAYKH